MAQVIARAHVIKPGRTLSVVKGDVFAQTAGDEKLVATMLATIMAVGERENLQQ